ncbi:DUF7553 family protein [Natronobacterium texcoconense]|uniref:Uncharacterized protein n=1 Tax=Natronobacterium texcoconense TaxID=1095778 RepID=A0A1H1G730_NATTX|nr:hypothetical protein [Natronobacterium texcoconense]SDR09011.1 hypothetical protein SAMN04489842_2294 [Natronobacterium texcoconense]
MNARNHFEDSLYYLRRAGEHAKLGFEETLETTEHRARVLVGRGTESEEEIEEPSRLETVGQRVETEARDRVSSAREQVARVRSEEQSADR